MEDESESSQAESPQYTSSSGSRSKQHNQQIFCNFEAYFGLPGICHFSQFKFSYK